MRNPILVRRIFSSIAGRYDFANHLLSGGLDYTWRMRVVRMVRNRNAERILDLATGSGDLALALQKACPQAKVIGADFCQSMLLQAQKKGLNALVNGDGTQLPFRSEVFDVVTVAFGLRNMENWPNAIQEMARVLSPGGRLMVLDFSFPEVAWIRAVYRMYLHHFLPTIATWVTGNREAYEYLGESIERFPQGQAMLDILEANGFQKAQVWPMCFGIVSLYAAGRR